MGEASALRWVWQVMRMNEDYFVKRVYGEIIEGEGVRGRPSVKQINEVDKYWREPSMVRRVLEHRRLETLLVWLNS